MNLDIADIDSLPGLRANLDGLLSILRDAYEKGPKNEPLDDDKTVPAIMMVGHTHDLLDVKAALPKEGKDDVRRYDTIASALNKTHELLAETRDGVMPVAWHGDNVEELPSGEIPAGWDIRRKERYDAAIDTVAQLARAAEYSAQAIRRENKRGHPHGGSKLPEQIIVGLARIFKEYTGRDPSVQHTWDADKMTKIETPFELFVKKYLLATGRLVISDRTIITEIRKAQGQFSNPAYLVSSKWPFSDEFILL